MNVNKNKYDSLLHRPSVSPRTTPNPPSPAEALDKVKACVSEIGPVTIAPPAE